MPEFVKRALEYISNTLGNMSGPQRLTVGILVVLIIGSIVWAATFAGSDGWVMIAGTDVSREERNQIITSLKAKNTKFEVRDESIFVPKEIADETVITLHGEGSLSDSVLWKFLDEGNLTSSKWQQEKRYQVALQRKLERMIRSMKMIRKASVQLTPGEIRKALGFRGQGPSASVMVELVPGQSLDKRSVKSIARIVAGGSLSGMKPHDVYIADKSGRGYRVPKTDKEWDFADTMRSLEEEYEKRFKSKILDIYEDARVSVRVIVSNERSKVREESAGDPVVVDEESVESTDKSTTKAATTSIKGEGKVLTGGTGSNFKMDKESSENRAKSFIPRKVEEKFIGPGKVTQTFATVRLPIYVGEEDDVQKLIQQETPKLLGYRNDIKNAIGVTDDKMLTVSFVPVRKPVAPPGPTTGDLIAEFFKDYGGRLILLFIALGALYIIYRLLKSALPKGMVEDLQNLRKRVTEEAALPEGELTLAEEEAERLKRSVREMAQKNPRTIATILKRWMTGK